LRIWDDARHGQQVAALRQMLVRRSASQRHAERVVQMSECFTRYWDTTGGEERGALPARRCVDARQRGAVNSWCVTTESVAKMRTRCALFTARHHIMPTYARYYRDAALGYVPDDACARMRACARGGVCYGDIVYKRDIFAPDTDYRFSAYLSRLSFFRRQKIVLFYFSGAHLPSLI